MKDSGMRSSKQPCTNANTCFPQPFHFLTHVDTQRNIHRTHKATYTHPEPNKHEHTHVRLFSAHMHFRVRCGPPRGAVPAWGWARRPRRSVAGIVLQKEVIPCKTNARHESGLAQHASKNNNKKNRNNS